MRIKIRPNTTKDSIQAILRTRQHIYFISMGKYNVYKCIKFN